MDDALALAAKKIAKKGWESNFPGGRYEEVSQQSRNLLEAIAEAGLALGLVMGRDSHAV